MGFDECDFVQILRNVPKFQFNESEIPGNGDTTRNLRLTDGGPMEGLLQDLYLLYLALNFF